MAVGVRLLTRRHSLLDSELLTAINTFVCCIARRHTNHAQPEVPRLQDCAEEGIGKLFYDKSKELAAACRFAVPCMQLIVVHPNTNHSLAPSREFLVPSKSHNTVQCDDTVVPALVRNV